MKLKFGISPLFFGLLALLSACNGQQGAHNVLGSEGKLATDDVQASHFTGLTILLHDASDAYWFTCDQPGVLRYNAGTITHFTTADGLRDDDILELKEDSRGNLYFNTAGGINKYDGEVFSTLTTPETSSTFAENSLGPDDVWFRGPWSENGVYRYDGEHLHHLVFPKNDVAEEYLKLYPHVGHSPYGVYCIYEDKSGTMWFGTSDSGIYRYDGKTVTWMYDEQLSITPEGGAFGIRSMIEDDNGNFWITNTRYKYDMSAAATDGNDNGVVKYSREPGVVLAGGSNEEDFIYFLSSVKGNDGDLWMVCGDEEVWRYDGKNMVRYPVQDQGADLRLNHIYLDRHGVIWVSSWGGETYKFDGEMFERFEV
jgi:ligand-binding sensor domain-containing protein